MEPAPGHPPSRPTPSESLLGAAHPLSRVIRNADAVARQARVAIMLLAAALAATAGGGATWAPAADLAAALTLGGLGAVAVALHVRARWEAREVIARGDEHLPLRRAASRWPSGW